MKAWAANVGFMYADGKRKDGSISADKNEEVLNILNGIRSAEYGQQGGSL